MAGDGYVTKRCVECGGSLVTQADLAMLFARSQPRRTLELAIHNDGSHRHECPVCSNKMDVTWIEFLRVESCELHGLWFAPGSLERLLAYDVHPPGGLPRFRKKKRSS